MTAQELMQTVETINNHAAALTTSSVLLGKTSSELKAAFDGDMLADDPRKFYNLVHKFAAALDVVTDVIEKLVTDAGTLVYEDDEDYEDYED